jgi:hypothetical protein
VIIECGACNGSGLEDEVYNDEDGELVSEPIDCPNCDGSGYRSILVSDAGGKMPPEEEPHTDWLRHSIRINSVIGEVEVE